MGEHEKLDNKLENAKGRIKEAAGDLTDDRSLQAEGKLDQASATVKDKAEQGVDAVKEGASKVADKAREIKDDLTD